MNTSFFLFVIFLVSSLGLFACSSHSTRMPADDLSGPISKYIFEDSFECQSYEEIGPERNASDFVRWSSLTGMMVGPQITESLKSPDEKILRPFISDGCSSSPEGLPIPDMKLEWIDCCMTHDLAYWLGGTEEDKENADQGLKQCITNKGFPRIGGLYYKTVQKFGGPDTTKTYRWGYGWNGHRSFSPLEENEVRQAEIMYDVPRSELSRVLFAEPMTIYRVCNSTDVAFNGYTSSDKAIYQFLNKKLKKNARLTWVQFKRSLPGKRFFLIKLDKCSEPIEIVLRKKKQKVISVKGGCSEFIDEASFAADDDANP